jgi:hypothetical protein
VLILFGQVLIKFKDEGGGTTSSYYFGIIKLTAWNDVLSILFSFFKSTR